MPHRNFITAGVKRENIGSRYSLAFLVLHRETAFKINDSPDKWLEWHSIIADSIETEHFDRSAGVFTKGSVGYRCSTVLSNGEQWANVDTVDQVSA